VSGECLERLRGVCLEICLENVGMCEKMLGKCQHMREMLGYAWKYSEIMGECRGKVNSPSHPSF
jgi:hypothetical protein